MSFLLRIFITLSALFTIYSCTKKSSSTSTQSNQPTQTNPNTNFSIDGVPANCPNSDGTANASNATYNVLAIDNSGYPQLKITFHGAITPSIGTYSIINGTVSGGAYCNFLLTEAGNYTATPSSGTVTISTVSTHSYEATFNNLTCMGSAGTHVVSGTIGY